MLCDICKRQNLEAHCYSGPNHTKLTVCDLCKYPSVSIPFVLKQVAALKSEVERLKSKKESRYEKECEIPTSEASKDPSTKTCTPSEKSRGR